MSVRSLTVALILLVALGLTSSAQAAPNPFRHDLDRVNGHLRIAVEYAPEELTESLSSAEVVCGLGERAAGRQEADLESVDRATLEQLIGEIAERDARRVDLAFGNADSTLAALRERFEARWGTGAPRSRELRRGVGVTRRGIAVMRAAVEGLAKPFQSWRTGRCTEATRGLERAFTHVGDGLVRINAGMQRLWRLAALQSSQDTTAGPAAPAV